MGAGRGGRREGVEECFELFSLHGQLSKKKIVLKQNPMWQSSPTLTSKLTPNQIPADLNHIIDGLQQHQLDRRPQEKYRCWLAALTVYKFTDFDFVFGAIIEANSLLPYYNEKRKEESSQTEEMQSLFTAVELDWLVRINELGLTTSSLRFGLWASSFVRLVCDILSYVNLKMFRVFRDGHRVSELNEHHSNSSFAFLFSKKKTNKRTSQVHHRNNYYFNDEYLFEEEH